MFFFDFFSGLPKLRPLSFQHYPDSFATTRLTLYVKLLQVLKALIHQKVQLQRQLPGESKPPANFSFFIAAHFPDEFFRLQNELDQHHVEYQIITRPLDSQWFLDHAASGNNVVYLALAEFLTETTFAKSPVFDSTLDLIVVDRHPEPFRDAALVKFARDFPAITRIGYFLALDDRVLKPVINETTLVVLKQMGIDDQGLVSSGIISKRINKVLARRHKQRTGVGAPADSAQEWFEINENFKL